MLRALIALVAAVAAPAWTRTDLPVPNAHPDMFVVSRGVNAKGAAIYEGTFGPAADLHQLSYLWRNGKLTQLTNGTADGKADWVDVYAINSSGTVVGDAGARAVVWRNAKPTVLAPEPSVAFRINDRGTVIGVDDRRAALWRDGVETLLDGVGTVTAINAQDEVIGQTPVGGQITHAMSWQNGVTTDLGSVGDASSWATGINSDGDIVGYTANSLDFPLTAIEWKDGQLVDLGTFGALGAQAVAINDAGDVLVQLSNNVGAPTAIVLVRDGTPIPVPGTVARGVDEQGQVLGYTTTAKHGRRSFVWQDGLETLLPTSDGAKPPFGGPNVVAGGWAIGDEYVVTRHGKSAAHAVLWHRR
jgi:probable HAF family extracellular repeat protein